MKSNISSTNQKPHRKASPWRKVPRTVGLYEWVSSGTYFGFVRSGGKLHRESLQTKDLELAKRKLVDFKRRLDRTDSRFGNVTLVAWLEDTYFPTLRGAARTLVNKRCILDRIKGTWLAARTQPMRNLKPTDVERWLNEQYGGWSPDYHNLALALVRNALAQAVRDRVIGESPAAHLTYQKRKAPIRLTPTWEQFVAIVADVRSQPFNRDADDSGDFLEAIGLLGLGQAELAGMKREHVDLESERVQVYRLKTATPFHVPIFPQGRALVERLCQGKRPTERLFPIDQARKALTNACKRLGFPAFTQRSLRRMFITRAIERGVDVKVIAQWQGHKDGGKLILDTYSHVNPIHSNRMAQLMTTDQPDNVIQLDRQTSRS
jgi:integrase